MNRLNQINLIFEMFHVLFISNVLTIMENKTSVCRNQMSLLYQKFCVLFTSNAFTMIKKQKALVSLYNHSRQPRSLT